MKRKLRIRFGFGETVAFEESGSDALKIRAASKCETNLLSNHPNVRRCRCARAHHRRCAREGLTGAYDGLCVGTLQAQQCKPEEMDAQQARPSPNFARCLRRQAEVLLFESMHLWPSHLPESASAPPS